MDRGVVEASRDFQCAALAASIALKYPFLERLAVPRLEGEWEEPDFLEAEWNSSLRRERRADNHGFE